MRYGLAAIASTINRVVPEHCKQSRICHITQPSVKKKQVVLHGETGNIGREASEIRLERARRSVHGKEERVILGYEIHTNGLASTNPKENMRAFLSIDDYAVTGVV